MRFKQLSIISESLKILFRAMEINTRMEFFIQKLAIKNLRNYF